MSYVKKTCLLILLAGIVFPFALNVKAKEVPGKYVIKLKTGISSIVLDDLKTDHRFEFSKNKNFRNIFTFEASIGLEELKKKYQGSFEYIEAVKTVKNDDIGVTPVAVFNDPGYTPNSQDIDKQWGIPKTGIDAAWAKTTGSEKNVVAIIDTGVDGTHEDLQFTHFVNGYNLLDSTQILPHTNSDDNGHGTLIAGVLGATANNGRGIVGTNFQISLMPIKALDSSGVGDSPTISEALVWAADNGATIINLSLGGVGFDHDTTLANAISYAFNKDIVIVAAAGNDAAVTGGNLDEEAVFPICSDNDTNMVIGVAAVDHNDLKPAFSNFGKNCIDVSAPGKRILSTINHDPFTKKLSSSTYAYASGTSLAVPFVSGQAALIKALYPHATNTQIRDRIITTTDPIDTLNLNQCHGKPCKGLLGSGRINVARSLEQEIVDLNIKEGDLVKLDETGAIYHISGGQKRLVSSFVLNQRFAGKAQKSATAAQLAKYPEGPYATPLEGTLVKLDGQPAIFVISQGIKLGVTYQVFLQRGFKFTDVKTVGYSEFSSWVNGSLLPPIDGTLVKAARNKTVYWVVGQVLHPVSSKFYADKGLKVFPIAVYSDKDIENFPKGEGYVK